MSRSLYDWLYRGNLTTRAKIASLFVVALLVLAAVAGGFWYHTYAKAKEKAEQQARQAAALQQKRQAITSFYNTSLAGGDTAGFLRLYEEMLRSRQPIEMAGFIENNFSCSTKSCDFSYKVRDNAIFSVQQKYFRDADYSPSFSEDTMDYRGIPAEMDSNPVLEAFKKHAEISQPVCNDLLNYIYSYNSLVEAEQRFKLTALPASSVTANEESLPGNPENYGLLVGKWQVSLPDNPVSVFSFWQHRPYSSSFIFQSVTGKQGTLDISGALLCKK